MRPTHGGDWAGYAMEYGTLPLDFSANTSPLGLPGGVKAAVIDSLDYADRYPDPRCRALTAKLAARYQVSPESILCGNGAADLIDRLALALRPENALVTAPTFGEYAVALERVGCEVRAFPLRQENQFQLTVDFLDWITPETDLVFLCEPNNPTGVTTPRPLLERVLERCREAGALLVVDECFGDFLDRPEEHTMEPRLEEHLLILKAFTKFYAMAGLRLGYCLSGNRALLEAMAQAGQPWPVSTPAQAAGVAALEETGYPRKLRALIQEQRPWLTEQLTALGCSVVPGEANYLLFFCPVPELETKLRLRGVLIRNCANYPGLCPGWYRVAVRTGPENQRLVTALSEVIHNG